MISFEHCNYFNMKELYINNKNLNKIIEIDKFINKL